MGTVTGNVPKRVPN